MVDINLPFLAIGALSASMVCAEGQPQSLRIDHAKKPETDESYRRPETIKVATVEAGGVSLLFDDQSNIKIKTR
jgi:hypothetical protein